MLFRSHLSANSASRCAKAYRSGCASVGSALSHHGGYRPSAAGSEAGFGGPLNAFEIMKAFIEAGAADAQGAIIRALGLPSVDLTSFDPLAQARTQAALSAYRGGKGDLNAVLAARKNEIEMRTQALFVEITAAGIRESHVHDVQITKEAPNYRVE